MQKDYLTWDAVYTDSVFLGQKITDFRTDFKGILAISRGGLFPALILSQYLHINLIDTCCLTSYPEGSTRGEDLRVLKVPDANLIVDSGKDWLVVDDLVDTGKTFQYVRNLYPEATFCSLYSKSIGQKLTDFFLKLFSQDTWIVFPWE